MSKINEEISAIRSKLKISKQEVFITDRFIYYTMMKFGKTLIKREQDRNKLFSNQSIVTAIPFIELEEVPKIDPCYLGFDLGCKILRNKKPLPDFIKSSNGSLINLVMSIDSSKRLQPTTKSQYLAMKNSTLFKYNKEQYYWEENNYLYFPDNDIEAVLVSGIVDGDTSSFYCSEPESNCRLRQEDELFIPEYMLGDISNMVFQDLATMLNIPIDRNDDGQNIAN